MLLNSFDFWITMLARRVFGVQKKFHHSSSYVSHFLAWQWTQTQRRRRWDHMGAGSSEEELKQFIMHAQNFEMYFSQEWYECVAPHSNWNWLNVSCLSAERCDSPVCFGAVVCWLCCCCCRLVGTRFRCWQVGSNLILSMGVFNGTVGTCLLTRTREYDV